MSSADKIPISHHPLDDSGNAVAGQNAGGDGAASAGAGDHGAGGNASWQQAPSRFALLPHEVHVWRARLPDLPDYTPLLSADEALRAARFYFEKDRAHFTAARGLLRTLLGSYLRSAPGDLQFAYGERGKPALARACGDLSFNVSHSHELALFAFTRGRAVGVDVECVAAASAGPEIAERFFSADEVASLHGVPPALQRYAFFAGWTRKEAYIKATGAGLFAALDRFTVSLAPGDSAALLDVQDDPAAVSHWTLRELHPGEGYAAAIAAEGLSWQLCCFDWQPSIK